MNPDAPTILIVEDDEEVNELLRYNLRRAGYRSLAEVDGNAAVAAVRAHAPDLVLLDVMLPGTDGWEICRALSEDPALRAIPVILFTARGSREDFDRGRRYSNVRGYFIKPYATADVIRHIARVLASPG